MDGVDPVLELLDLTSREPVEVHSLRVPPAHEAGAVLNGPFFFADPRDDTTSGLVLGKCSGVGRICLLI